jgi:hypothetical protein
VTLKDQEYWDISNVEISNQDPNFNPNNTSNTANADMMGNLRGVHVYGQSHSDNGITPGGVLDGIRLHHLYIHDVSGHVYWGGSPTDRGYPGVYGSMGNDASKRTGGIVFEVWQPTTESNLSQAQNSWWHKRQDFWVPGHGKDFGLCQRCRCCLTASRFNEWNV